jgi:hypothetical protein
LTNFDDFFAKNNKRSCVFINPNWFVVQWSPQICDATTLAMMIFSPMPLPRHSTQQRPSLGVVGEAFGSSGQNTLAPTAEVAEIHSRQLTMAERFFRPLLPQLP